MNQLYEKCRKYIANPDQLCYARLSSLEEGSGRGQRIVDVCNGTGLAFTITPDRGMNLVECSYKGIPIAYRTACGHRSPIKNWLHNWTGGMMTTAGLRNVGVPSGAQTLHGDISGESAEHLSTFCKDGEICVSGVLREGAMFDASLILERSIKTSYGCNSIAIHDIVTNNTEAPLFSEILYHCNFGYPFISPALKFEASEHQIIPRDEEAESGLKDWACFPEPMEGFHEQCYRHILHADKNNIASMRLINADLGIAVRISYNTSTLTSLVEWKKPSKFGYVLGLEPTNGSLKGCEFDQKNGFGIILNPQESIEYWCSLSFETI